VQFEISFFGHENVRSLHTKTIEITRDSKLTPSGDCIIGTKAFCGCYGIPKQIKKKLKDPNTKVIISIIVNGYSFLINGKGHKDLTCTHPDDIVLRKSNFICPRTLAINCDKSSDQIPRKLIRMLQNPKTKGKFKIEVN
jgi:uncharacterized protein